MDKLLNAYKKRPKETDIFKGLKMHRLKYRVNDKKTRIGLLAVFFLYSA